MSPSSPSVLSLLKVGGAGTRASLRQAELGRADSAEPGAGFAATLERRSTRTEQSDGNAHEASKSESDDRDGDRDRSKAAESRDKSAGATETSAPADSIAGLAEVDQAHAERAQLTAQTALEPTDPSAIARAAEPDLTQISRQLATQAVAEQAKTGPVTAKILSELSLQGQSVGRFALVAPQFKPGSAATSAKPGADAPAASTPVTSTQDGTIPASLSPTPLAQPTAAPLVAQPAPDPAPSARQTQTVTQAAAASPAATEPASGADTPRPAARTSEPAAPATAPVQTGQNGASRQDQGRQDQPSRQPDTALRGLDAMLGRAAAKPRAAQSTADTNANRALSTQIERGVSAALNARDGVVTLRLSPEQLGPLKIRVSVDKGAVKAAFEASTPQAKQAVERSLTGLKESLESRGLKVEHVEVTLAPQLPQRDVGLPAVAPDASQLNLGQSSVGGQSASADQQHQSKDHASSRNYEPDAHEMPIDLNTADNQPGLRYITTPDGRLGVVALA